MLNEVLLVHSETQYLVNSLLFDVPATTGQASSNSLYITLSRWRDCLWLY